jgi:uncharacterized protein YndB with AHSA1/START domain
MADGRAAEGRFILDIQRWFAVEPARVFEAWTSPEALRRWWCPPGWEPAFVEVNLRTGGRWRIGMRPQHDNSVVSVGGRFLEVQPPTVLIYTWRRDGAFAGMPETQVTVTFNASRGGTELRLVHAPMVDVVLWERHRAGWVAACDRMEQIL